MKMLRQLQAIGPPGQFQVFLLFLCCFSAISMIKAQVQKGQIYLGGSLFYENNGANGQKTNSLSLSPELGWMATTKWSFGLGAPFRLVFSKTKRPNTELAFVPFARYYADLKSGFYAVFQLQGQRFSLTETNLTGGRFELNFSPRMVYFISPKFGLEAGLGSIRYELIRHQRAESRQRGLYGSFDLFSSFSLRYYFPKDGE
jgi:hypothetical protein